MAAENFAYENHIAESDYLFMKTYSCPVCDSTLRIPTVKSGKTRMISQDWDLRPIYKGIDPVKYDVIHCNHCGYAAIIRYHGVLAKPHKEMILNSISANYKPLPVIMYDYGYDEAIKKFKMALLNASVRHAHNSEMAYIALKIAWLYRGSYQELGDYDELFEVDQKRYDEFKACEEEYLQKALDAFVEARQNETPPFAGMNEIILDFLIASLCIHFDKYEDASRLISGILQSSKATSQQKDKARDMLYEMKNTMKK